MTLPQPLSLGGQARLGCAPLRVSLASSSRINYGNVVGFLHKGGKRSTPAGQFRVLCHYFFFMEAKGNVLLRVTYSKTARAASRKTNPMFSEEKLSLKNSPITSVASQCQWKAMKSKVSALAVMKKRTTAAYATIAIQTPPLSHAITGPATAA
ncbi:hypothetical protein E2562_013241 [Oryza meyeriana var. granulata]|uniref:Uncharacterized protein n=1 Tax=Oryza meyeriana var. granulata TaxID=110450 RepID=A0A6G1D352_9ORYZ|nr:hypothetical protein E2562_013241 [Oryza meyeriana var. granulata]